MHPSLIWTFLVLYFSYQDLFAKFPFTSSKHFTKQSNLHFEFSTPNFELQPWRFRLIWTLSFDSSLRYRAISPINPCFFPLELSKLNLLQPFQFLIIFFLLRLSQHLQMTAFEWLWVVQILLILNQSLTWAYRFFLSPNHSLFKEHLMFLLYELKISFDLQLFTFALELTLSQFSIYPLTTCFLH